MKLFLKTVFLMVVLLLLVMMGLKNRTSVTFYLPFSKTPVLPESITLPAAIMYFTFFAVGVVTATVLLASRGGGKGEAAASSKPSKSKMIR